MPNDMMLASVDSAYGQLNRQDGQQRRQTEHGQSFELAMPIGMFAVGRRASNLDNHERDDVIGEVGERMNGVTENRKRPG